MRRRGSKKVTLLYMLIFVAAIALSILAARFLPIPADWKRLVFFLLVVGISFGGVVAAAKITKNR